MGGRGASMDGSRSCRAVAGDASLMSSSDDFAIYISKRVDVDPEGKFDLIAHGTPFGIEVEHNGDRILVNSRTAAKLIKRLPGYSGQDIRLLSCSTGSQNDGFAQNLANKLNVTVYAPSDILWAFPSGYYVIAPASKASTDQSIRGPDLRRRGRFIEYKPGGGR